MAGFNRAIWLGFVLSLLVAAACLLKFGNETKKGNRPDAFAAQRTDSKVKRVVSSAKVHSRLEPGPHFEHQAAGGFVAQAASYRATLDEIGELHYQPLSKERPDNSAELQIALNRVSLGERNIFDRSVAGQAAAGHAGPEPKLSENGDKYELSRKSDFKEYYAPRGDGVEQSFTFDKLPEGSGDLQFSFNLKFPGLIPVHGRPVNGGGIQFFDTAGRFAVRYGQVFVRDSAMHSISLEPRFVASSGRIEFSVPGTWLRSANFPVTVDPVVGGDFQISPDNPNGVAPPTVVAGINNYLVVWDDFTTGTTTPQLMASLITGSGVASTPFALSSVTGAPRAYRFQRTEAAFDGTNWLVVWSEDEVNGAQIHGVLVSAGNTVNPAGAVLFGSDFSIANTTGTVEEDPEVAFNGSDFIVAWQSGIAGDTGSSASTESQIYYTRVTSEGVVGLVQVLTAQTNPPNQYLLFLSPQRPSGDTLLIYRENGERPAATRASRIALDGTLRDVGGISLFTADRTIGGFGQPIGSAFINSSWAILSSYDQTTDSAVYMHQVSTDGVVTPPQGVFATVGLGPTGSALDQFAPVFPGYAGVSTNGNTIGTWLFLRNERVNSNTYHILGKRVGFDGTDQDPIPFQVDTSTHGILRNAVAAQSGALFMAAWLDGRRATTAPLDAHNIFGALIDATIGDNTGPALLPVIAASPTSGQPPLTVSFDSSGSTGSFDTLAWAFGDGSTSTFPTVSHTYTQNGIYTAQLALAKGSYTVIRSVLITVGTGGGTGNGAGNEVGTPIQSSPDLVANLFIKAASVSLDFTQSTNDNAEVLGTIDLGALPASLTGVTGSFSIGNVSHPFSLDAKGQFKSDAAQRPLIALALNPTKGIFDWQVQGDSLQSAFANLGALNITTTPTIIDVPITMQIGTFSATSTVGVRYKATQNQSGAGSYSFLKTGKTVSGAFLVSKFSAKEQDSATGEAHSYSIQGQLVRPGDALFKPSPSGQFTFIIGNYSLSFPSSQFVAKGGALQYKSRPGVTGLQKFSIDMNSGKFSLQMTQVPATGIGGSGLWLATGNNIVNAGLNLSFRFDLADQQLAAGRFIFIARKKASSKAWGLE